MAISMVGARHNVYHCATTEFYEYLRLVVCCITAMVATIMGLFVSILLPTGIFLSYRESATLILLQDNI